MASNLSPLAQTFKVNEEFTQGVFLTSVELFFAYTSPTETEPVEIQIVETFNGYPTDNIVEGSRVLVYPENIPYSASNLVPVKFKFDSLVELESGTEYALKVISNSQKYKIWTSVMGMARVDNPSILITQQPALGSLFKSQNNSTWTPEQLQDLTFRLNRAKFNTSVLGRPLIVDTTIANIDVLPVNPFKITNGSTKVKVHQINHGLEVGLSVTFYDCASDAMQFNGTFAVASVINSDYYTITTAAQTSTNNVGGSLVKTEKTVKYDTIRVLGVSEGRDVGTSITAKLSSAATRDAGDTDLTADEFTDLTVNKYLHSSINKANKLAGAPSFTLKPVLSSHNDAVSPVINLESLAVQLMSNKINKPSVSDVNYDIDGESIAIASGTTPGTTDITFSATGNTIRIPTTSDYTKIKLGAWIGVASSTSNNTKHGYISNIDSSTNLITIVGDTLVNETSTTAVITQYTSFVSEIANGGTAESKHITKQVNLKNKCTGFRILLDANIHVDADIELYYRTSLQSGSGKLSEKAWTNSLISYKKSVNETDFIEYEYNITDIEKFDQFQFKIVFLSSNSAVTPKIKLLRVIAHA